MERTSFLAASKGGQGIVFALVAVAVICLLGMANAARKHKKRIGSAGNSPTTRRRHFGCATGAGTVGIRLQLRSRSLQRRRNLPRKFWQDAIMATVQTVAEAKHADETKRAVETGELKVASAPAGAQVEIDGRILASWTTPFTDSSAARRTSHFGRHAGLETSRSRRRLKLRQTAEARQLRTGTVESDACGQQRSAGREYRCRWNPDRTGDAGSDHGGSGTAQGGGWNRAIAGQKHSA